MTVGPLLLAHETPREQFLTHGHVVTFRAGSKRTTGETHVRWERTGTAQADCVLEYLEPVDPSTEAGREALAAYVEASGFESLDDWLDAMADLNGQLQPGHLYHARFRGARTDAVADRATERARYPETVGRYREASLDEARCPDCGDEEQIIEYERVGKIQPMPAEQSGKCKACGNRDHPLAFHHAYKWERMTEAERSEAQRQREKYEAEMAAWQESASYHAEQREP